jgi:hypothetical protein
VQTKAEGGLEMVFDTNSETSLVESELGPPSSYNFFQGRI